MSIKIETKFMNLIRIQVMELALMQKSFNKDAESFA